MEGAETIEAFCWGRTLWGEGVGADPGGPHTRVYPHHWKGLLKHRLGGHTPEFLVPIYGGPEGVLSQKDQVMQTPWAQGPHFENDCCTDGFQLYPPEIRGGMVFCVRFSNAVSQAAEGLHTPIPEKHQPLPSAF